MSEGDSDFRVRPGRIRSTRAPKPKSFINQVRRAAKRAGHTDGDRADDAAFAERSKDDRHHFRFIVSPEDASEMTDLRAFTRDFAVACARAEEFVSSELGPRPEHEIRNALDKEMTAERWTRLDVEIRIAADETGYIDLRLGSTGAADPDTRCLMVVAYSIWRRWASPPQPVPANGR
jgi:hypothetical protein